MSRLAVAAAVLVAAAGPLAAQVFTPIPVTGYTQDVIADAGNPLPSLTTTSPFDLYPTTMQNGPGYVLYQQGFNPSFPTRGVPANGLIVTSATRSYQLGPINGNNSLHLFSNGTAASTVSGALTLVAPARYAALSLLLADGNGRQPSQGGYPGTLAVNWSNGNSTAYPYTVYDWFLLSGTPGPNSGVAIGGLDRVTRDFSSSFENSTTDPRLYYYDIDLTADPNYLAGALIDSVTATGTQTGTALENTNIMGLSGATAVPEPSALALAGLAAGGLAWRRGRRRQPPCAAIASSTVG
ncbi:MAG TPA: PEP-CTERM sorting domain-containing protein [Gemmataceae bacterium]|jgi:hypothetical protein